MEPQHPHFRSKENKIYSQLIVNDKPFLVLGAGLHNSSMSSAEHMKSIWQELREDHINTVLGTVTWEQVEPVEGKFDFTNLDKILQGARLSGLHLIILWCGAFMNGCSTSVPGWVKKDQTRFPRAKLRRAGGRVETADVLSIFDPKQEAMHAEIRAFETLMQHIKNLDEGFSTVIMIQVESEVGILGDSRDGSAMASERFAEPVPTEFVEKLNEQWDSLHDIIKANLQYFKQVKESKPNGSWVELLGGSAQTDEIFMAFHYAKYVEQIAAAGKKIYPLPFYTNVWQKLTIQNADSVVQSSYSDNPSKVSATLTGGEQPGDYPSGGGVIDVLDIWQLFAPSLDFIAPNIYLTEYVTTISQYQHRAKPLFIPKQRRDEYGARYTLFAIGASAIGTSPFGIDTVKIEHGFNPYKKYYELLSSVSPIILAEQAEQSIDNLTLSGFVVTENSNLKIYLILGEWRLCIERAEVFGKAAPGSGIIILLKEGGGSRFLLIGWGFQVSFTSTRPKAHFTGILSFKEKEVVDPATGELRTRRLLNGDETRSGKYAVMPNENPDYGGHPVSTTIPAGTAIAEVEVYALEEE